MPFNYLFLADKMEDITAVKPAYDCPALLKAEYTFLKSKSEQTMPSLEVSTTTTQANLYLVY
jgi:hypothetical protein